jgi:hypothetical protein
MLKINAQEQQKHRESLSSDRKACMLKINAKEQQKHRESLSPNMKACIKESNTAHFAYFLFRRVNNNYYFTSSRTMVYTTST